MKIRTKITGMGLLLVLLTASCIVGIAYYQEKVLERNVDAEVEQLVRNDTTNVAQDVYLMCRTMQESLERILSHGLKVAVDVASRQGHLDFNSSSSFTWQAVNQYTGEKRPVELPKVLYNGRWLGHNRDMKVPTPVVDRVTELLGVTCTVFQRINEAGDMLRIATTVPGLDDNRAIGTYIPRYNPDGASNPVIESLLRGEVYTGRAYVVNDWYLTGYQPLWDDAGTRVIGALYVGQKQDGVTSLRRGITDIVIGKSGYVAVVGGRGNERGKYQISRGGRWDGVGFLEGESIHPNGSVMQQIVDKALALDKVEDGDAIPTAYLKYRWQNIDESRPRFKSAAITYFEPWDWIILATAYDDDYVDTRQRMVSALWQMIEWVVGVAAAIIVLSLLVGYFVARGIVRPLEEAMAVFHRIGQGQLDLQLNVTARDEIGQLSRSFNQMVVNLKEVTASRDELNHEIVERTLIEKELRETSARREDLELIVNNSPAVAILCRAEFGWPVEYISENISQFGFDADDFIKGRLLLSSIMHDGDQERVEKEVLRYSKSPMGDSLVLEHRILNRRGEEFWIETRLWCRRNEAGEVTHYQGVSLDVTARKEAEETINQLAYYDALTGLPNRSLFMSRLQQVLPQAQRDERMAALMFIDLDRFKEVNDRWGHAFGDKLLNAVGLRLASCIRQNDTLARFGGDEFVMLIAGVNAVEDVRTVAEKILAIMAEPFCIDQHRFDISTSIGIAVYPQDGGDTEILLKRADAAMYVAKDMGRNGYCFFDPKMERKSRPDYARQVVAIQGDLVQGGEMV